MPAPKHITEQQRKFAEGVAAHGNHTRAAEEAGYKHPHSVGTRLMKLRRVADEVVRVRGAIAKKADRKTVADANEIQVFLTKVMRGQVKDYDLTLSGDVEELPPKLAERRKASMDLAKVQGLLKERVEHTGAGGGPIELAGVPFRELLELARTGGGDGD
jgi:phage terminase small subunit